MEGVNTEEISQMHVPSNTLRAGVRLVLLILASLVLFPVCGLIIVSAGLFGSRVRYRVVTALTGPFCRLFAAIMGLRVSINGKRSTGAQIFVANHVTYLDILVAGIAASGVFVSRDDVKDWPVIGWFGRLAGTVFIDRTSLRSAIVSSRKVVQRAKEGIRVTFFPEGGTTGGEGVGKFKAFMFGGIVESGFTVQPFTILYTHIGKKPITVENHRLIYWYNPAPGFVSHGWYLLGLSSVSATVQFHQPLERPSHEADNDAVREFAEEVRAIIAGTIPPLAAGNTAEAYG